MASKVYIIARGLVAGSPSEESGIDYVPGSDSPITFWDYDFFGPNSDGGSVSAKEALTSWHRRELQRLGAEWFVPFLERMAAGEEVQLSDINARHIEIFGRELQRRPSRYPPGYDDEGRRNPDTQPPPHA